MSKYHGKILELFDEGLIGKDELVTNLINWLSESDAKEFWDQYYDDYENDDQPIWATKLVPGIARY